ncbi:thiamine-phosphate kinase [Luteimonas yindakuii]|uniref:Thiamine-monophosphate kinase n=1 Tax=Luteimonas yindakuii TaxID=2565782 RepID=A0A4Z1R593_9GAMM|nr:thiamine-phosphate kinase [Luteimonas yindakuii]TKS54814.1 thiamine-phosphate kinase [Luteimonas yindakuii]
MSAEFDLIARIRARAGGRADVVLGIGDDAAVLQPPPGRQLVVCTDTLNAGVHFPDDTAPADIGWKALAVNLSDLAAMGAVPAWCTLSLSLPDADPARADALLDGVLELATLHGVVLVGGDTTRGPLSLCVTAIGHVAPGHALRRDGAGAGDDLWVSGTLGDAAAALRGWSQGDAVPAALRARLDRPTPRVALGAALSGLASAAIDVSDGLLADLGHVLEASGIGAEVDVDALPASAALPDACPGLELRRALQASGGDDYELCFTAPPALREAVQAAAQGVGTMVTRIGRMVADRGLQCRTAGGEQWESARAGYEHFAG